MVKHEPYQLSVINGDAIDGAEGWVGLETDPARFELADGHAETISFNVADIGAHDIILGMPWIVQHNLIID